MKRFVVLLLLLSLTCICFAKSYTPKVTQVRISENQHRTRIVLELTNTVHYRAFTLSFPDRLVVDFDKAEIKKTIVLPTNDMVARMRTSKATKPGVRLVFDLKKRAFANVFTLPPAYKIGPRVVIDLTTKRTMVKEKPPIPEVTKPKVRVPKRKKLREIVVVIDPGHGGKDPGAIGGRGTREKDVVLAISKRLQAKINQQPGMRAVLTRNTDRYISLRQRLAIARKHTADLFIAIHADAFHKKHSHGASVFALSERGASSEAARWLAERENVSEIGQVSWENKSKMLKSVLLDLSQTATIMASLQLGGEVLDKLSNITDLHNRKVEQAQFVVLKSPDIPSLLIETGFISNRAEERRLTDPIYQNTLADAITRGIKAYFWAHAPHDSWMALQENAHEYEVARGDSLEKISQRFQVSKADIMQVNKLRSQRLNAGQVLTIPHPNQVNAA